MPECETVGCSMNALTPPLCSLCAIGKGPTDEQVRRAEILEARRPRVTYMGAIENLKGIRQYDRHFKSAENFALAPGADGSLTTVDGVRVHHRTVPRVNYSIWYVRTGNTAISVYGFGRHIGTDNKKYSVEWYDGRTITVNL